MDKLPITYRLVEVTDNRKLFERKVSALLRNGWQLAGSLIVTHLRYPNNYDPTQMITTVIYSRELVKLPVAEGEKQPVI